MNTFKQKKEDPSHRLLLMCLLSGDPVQGNALHSLTGMLRIIEGRLSSRASGSAQGKNQAPYRL